MLAVLEMSENVRLLFRTCIITVHIHMCVILYSSLASDVSLFAYRLSHASDLKFFVPKAIHVTRQRGLNPLHLGRGYLPLVRCVTLTPCEALTYEKKKVKAAAGPRS